MEALKARLRSTWMAGDFGQIARFSSLWAEEFISRLPVTAGMKVLDVACGTGNLSIPAARRGATVTGVDIAPNLLEQARARAEGEGLKIQFDEGDAEQLPYGDASFDLVVSMFGAMFAPRPERATAELIRVCRSGGRIAMANWTPEGFTGKMFRLNAKHVPPPPGVPPPVLWGDVSTVRERLRDGISDLTLTRRTVAMVFPFDEVEVVEFFRRFFGPAQRAFEALDPAKQADLRRDLEHLWKENNRSTDGTTNVESEYLEVVAVRD
jgi:SAM-dependent methyltransferase